MNCKCFGEYKCYEHRRQLHAWAVKYDVGSRIHLLHSVDGIQVTISYSVKETKELIVDLQRAIKATGY